MRTAASPSQTRGAAATRCGIVAGLLDGEAVLTLRGGARASSCNVLIVPPAKVLDAMTAA